MSLTFNSGLEVLQAHNVFKHLAKTFLYYKIKELDNLTPHQLVSNMDRNNTKLLGKLIVLIARYGGETWLAGQMRLVSDIYFTAAERIYGREEVANWMLVRAEIDSTYY